MSNKGTFSGCLKFGCFGCLSTFALGVGLILLLGAIQFSMSDEEPQVEEREARHELPDPPPMPAYASADQPEMPNILPMSDSAEAPVSAAGTLVLDLRMGDFTIEPGPADQPIRVEADYNTKAFTLKENYLENDDGTWKYEVTFGGRGGLLGALLRGNNSNNKVTITIPRGHPIEIVGRIGMGESESDLGGLWITRVDLDLSAGDHFLEFREPLPFPMDEFNLDSSMGSLEVRTLGGASPRKVEVEHGMGELLLDLEGEWRRDAEIDVQFSMGECRLWSPDSARLEIGRASVGLGEKRIKRQKEGDLPANAPTLTLNVSGSMGELRIEN